MRILEDLIRRLEAAPDVAGAALPDVVGRHQGELLDANREQMEAGKRTDGGRISPEYSPATQLIKQIEGQVFDHVTLKDTGDFYESLRLDFFPDGFGFDATDSKTGELLAKYGADVLGLSAGALAHFRETAVRPEVLTALRAHLARR